MSRDDFLAAEGKTAEEFDADSSSAPARRIDRAVRPRRDRRARSTVGQRAGAHRAPHAQRAALRHEPGPVRPAVVQAGQVPVLVAEVVRGKALALVLEAADRHRRVRPRRSTSRRCARTRRRPTPRTSTTRPVDEPTTPATSRRARAADGRRDGGRRRRPTERARRVRVTRRAPSANTARVGDVASRCRALGSLQDRAIGRDRAPDDTRQVTRSERARSPPGSRTSPAAARRSPQRHGPRRPGLQPAAARADHLPRLGGRGRQRQRDLRAAAAAGRRGPRHATSASTSTRPAARSRPAWRSTTRCSSSRTTSPPWRWAWPPRWASSCSAPAPPGKRYALPHARIMMHQPSGGIGGTASDIRIQAEQMLLHQEARWPSCIALHTGQTVETDRGATPTATAGSPPRRPRTTASSTTSSAAPARSSGSGGTA